MNVLGGVHLDSRALATHGMLLPLLQLLASGGESLSDEHFAAFVATGRALTLVGGFAQLQDPLRDQVEALLQS